jgi:hypothetical protein
VEEQPGLFLEGEDGPTGIGRRSRRRLAVIVASVTCLAVVGIPVGLVLASGGPNTSSNAHANRHHPHGNVARLGNGPAERQVLSALSATTSSGSFNVAYDLTESPGSVPSVTTTTCVSSQFNDAPINGAQTGGAVAGASTSRACGGGIGPQNVSVTGQGTIDTSPFAMAVSADVSNFGKLAIRVDSTDVWELGGADYGLTPQPGDNGPGSSLPGFAGLVEGTLGQREGAIAMLGMASPTGFLDLSQQAVTGAAEVGTGDVGGVPVTEYDVSIDLSQLAQVQGGSSDEATTIQAAVQELDATGYTGTMVKVAIDGGGFIREVTPVADFSDGGKVSLDATFSNFGCAGTVLMPGQQAATTTTAPAAGCVSPDTTTGASTTTTTTGTVPSTTGTGPITTEAPPTPTRTGPTNTGTGPVTTGTPPTTA